MKVLVEAKPLKLAFRAISDLLPEHQVILRAEDSSLVMEAGVGGVYLRQVLPATVDAEGEIVVNIDFLPNLGTDHDVALFLTEEGKLGFRAGKLRGAVEVHHSSEKIADQRPQDDIDISVQISKDIFGKAIRKVNFAVVNNNSQEGLFVQIDDFITISTTDLLRAALYKAKLPYKMGPLSLMAKASLIAKAMDCIQEPEIWLGANSGTLHIGSPSFSLYHPLIQQKPSPIEQLVESFDADERICELTTAGTEILETFLSTFSIVRNKDYESSFLCHVKDDELWVRISEAHGSAENVLKLQANTAVDHKVNLPCRYTNEMLGLLKDGDIRIGIWESNLVLRSDDNTTTLVLPTVS